MVVPTEEPVVAVTAIGAEPDREELERCECHDCSQQAFHAHHPFRVMNPAAWTDISAGPTGYLGRSP